MSPDNPWCERPNKLYNHDTGEILHVRCDRSSRAICGPCGERYRRRVARVFISGFVDHAGERAYGLTLTAPGVRAHCRRHKRCDASGEDCDPCPCTVEGGVDLHKWNYELGSKWNRFMQELRREFGHIEYAKAVEPQERGALHFHAGLRLTATTADLTRHRKRVRELAIKHGFGHSVDVQRIGLEQVDKWADERVRADQQMAGERAGWYMAKYASKTCDQRHEVPTLNKRGEPVMGSPRVRVWTSSRRWGDSMKSVKAAQRAWAVANAGGPSGVASPGGAEGALDNSSPSYTEEISPHNTE